MLKQRARDRVFKRAVGFLFVASAIALILFLRMYQQTAGPFKDTFRLSGTVPRADGIEIDSPVTLAGIKIGRVSNISLGANDQVVLNLEILASYHEKIRADSKAIVNKPIIGSAFVAISMGSLTQEKIANRARIEMTRAPDINDLVATLPPKLEQIDVVLANVTAASESLKQVAKSVTEAGGPLDNSLKNIEKTTREAATVTTRVGATLTSVQRIIEDTGASVSQVNAVLADIKQGTARVDAITLKVDNVLSNVQTISEDLKHVTPQLAQQLPPVIDAGRDTLNEADDVLRAAKNSIFLRGNVPPPPSGPLPVTTR